MFCWYIDNRLNSYYSLYYKIARQGIRTLFEGMQRPMNIRDIAAAAQVSVSTVSKVLNRKDSDISEATRQKVLKLAREYQYTPYSNIKKQSTPPGSNVIALVILSEEFYAPEFLQAAERTASENGYSLLLCDACEGGLERHMKILLTKRVDGQILCLHSAENLAAAIKLADSQFPLAAVTSFHSMECSTMRCSFETAAKEAVEFLAERGHQRIGFLLDDSIHTIYEQIYSGIISGLHSCALPGNRNIITCQSGQVLCDSDLQEVLSSNPTAIYCQTKKLTMQAYDYLTQNGISVPQGMSLLCGMGDSGSSPDWLTAYTMPYGQLAQSAVHTVTKAASIREPLPVQDICLPMNFFRGSSVSAPSGSEAPILVLGNFAYDTILSVSKLLGNTQLLDSTRIVSAPGGKCLAQSIAITRLGGCAYAIGRIGNDPEGRSILNLLVESGVHTNGVVTDSAASTGHSYLTAASNGEYSVVSYSGANRFLDTQPIKNLLHLFPSAIACLITTEVPAGVVKQMIRRCIPHQMKIYLKPSVPIALTPSLLEHIDYLIPNENELDQLLPGQESLEEKAAYLYQQGCKNVIVTLANNGCYLKNGQYTVMIPAADFKPVESTSAANCFIAALAMSLSRKNDLLYALSYATYAAGISISQQGSYSSFPCKQQMDLYLDEINNFYLTVLEQSHPLENKSLL